MKKQTLMQKARKGVTAVAFRQAARSEELTGEEIRDAVATGRIALCRPGRGAGATPCAVGAGTRVKVNANVGTSHDRPAARNEIVKLRAAIDAGTDTVMDLSTGGDLDRIRRMIIAKSPVPVGTVPIYQSAVEVLSQHPGRIDKMSADSLFDAVEKHGRDGVSFVTVHCGLTLESLERIKRQGRILGIVSRGGAFTAEWMIRRGEENPLYSQYDRLLEIAARHDLVLSLGDALRPGCLDDATDRGQVQELIILGELTKRAWEAGVQVMVEGPGHVPLDQIETNVQLQKKLCHGAPFYILGPLVTDCAPGYDHITSAIGGALAARAGADFLCYVTPSEHLGLPGPEEVRAGVVTARIAAHAADVARGSRRARGRDRRMSLHRRNLDWKGQEKEAIDPLPIREMRKSGELPEGDVCTMCGPYCSIKGMRDVLACRPPKGGSSKS